MTVKEAKEILNGKILTCQNQEERNISGVYACDLLSWAMSNVKEDNLWITIQTNLNIVAVASLTDASVIVIPEGLSLEEIIIKTAEDKEVMIMVTELTAYEICKALGKYL